MTNAGDLDFGSFVLKRRLYIAPRLAVVGILLKVCASAFELVAS
jgi:hypothetical protein